METIVSAPVLEIHTGPVYASIIVESPELAREAQPGQFLHIRCGSAQLRRPISIAGVEVNRLQIVFEIKGKGTRWLAQRQPGECLDILGPLGHGFPKIDGKILLVGGGVGVPPMHFAAQRAEASDVVLAFRSADRGLMLHDFDPLCQAVTIMSDDGSLGTRGFAAQGVAAMLAQGSYSAVFACGPKIMLKTTFETCQAAGVPCYVSLEERMGCGLGACLTCAPPIRTPEGGRVMKEACKDGPVFCGEEVIWDA